MWYWCGKKDVGDRLMHFFFILGRRNQFGSDLELLEILTLFSGPVSRFRIIGSLCLGYRNTQVERQSGILETNKTGYICNMREKKGLIRQNELNREGFRGEDMILENHMSKHEFGLVSLT